MGPGVLLLVGMLVAARPPTRQGDCPLRGFASDGGRAKLAILQNHARNSTNTNQQEGTVYRDKPSLLATAKRPWTPIQAGGDEVYIPKLPKIEPRQCWI